MPKLARKYSLSAHTGDLLIIFISVNLRPTEYPGRFSILIYGKHLDHDALIADKNKIYEWVKERTGRDELVFKSMPYISEWR